MIKEFISHFWKPLIQCLPDKKELKEHERFSYSKMHDLNVLIQANKTKPMGLFFTPNGNYWEVNKWLKNWEKFKRWERDFWENSCNALRVDFDIKDTEYKNLDEYYKAIITECKFWGMRPSIVVQSWWWFHVYFIIHPEDRAKVFKIGVDTFFWLILFINKLFNKNNHIWADPSSVSMNKLMRVPWSFHKKWEDKMVTCRSVDKKWEKTDDFSGMLLINFQAYQHAIMQVEENKNVYKNKDKLYSNMKHETVTSIQALDFPTVFEKLEKYPRKDKQGNNYYYQINSDKSISIISENGSYRPDWYKYCPQDWWYINNFTKDIYDIEERPRWPLISFLYYYFRWSMSNVHRFLKKEFDISIFSKIESESIDEEIQHSIIEMDDYSVVITDKRVFIKYVYKTPSGKDKVRESVVLKKWLYVKGKTKTNIDIKGREVSHAKNCYIFSVDWEDFRVQRQVTKRLFNEMTDKIFWYWSDDELGMFFEAIDSYKEIPIMISIDNNWYRGWSLYMWWHYIMWDNSNHFNNIPYIREKKDHELKEIQPKNFLDELCSVWSEEISIPCFLQTLAMAWLNKWKWVRVAPNILLTWWTWAGKSTLTKYLKQMLWYDDYERRYTLKGMTADPVKQDMSNCEILHYDEITWDLKPWVEDLVRNLVNLDITKKWTANGNPVVYNLVAPTFFTWERAFSEESINNRMVCIPMAIDKGRAWWDPKILEWITSKRYIFTQWLVEDKHLELYNKKIDVLRNEYKLDPRPADVRWYTMAMNEMFNIGIEEWDIVKYAKKHLSMMWFVEKKKTDPYMQMKAFVLRWLAKQRISMTYNDWLYWEDDNFDIFILDENYEQQNRAIINEFVSSISWQDVNIKYDFSNIHVSIDGKTKNPHDKAILQVLNLIRLQFKHVVHYVWL